MGISSYVRECKKVIAGNNHKLYIGRYGEVDTATFIAGKLSDLTVEADKDFAAIEADIDSVQFTSDGTAQRGYFSEQNLIARFSHKTKALEDTVNELLNGVVCGLVIIRIDNNGRGWVSGIADEGEAMANKPWSQLQEEFDSGESIEAVEDGNRYTLTFTRRSGTREYELTEDLVKDILAEETGFIDGHTPAA